jgi:formate dehydrogenase maturation protein FdhE
MDLDDFGPEARMYAEWLKENGGDLRILQYGFKIQKQELKEYVVSDQLDNVLEQVKAQVEAKDDPLSAVLVGVDDPWEVSLLKLMVELVQHSANGNMQDIQALNTASKESLTYRIDQAFLEASRDRSQINTLADILKTNDLWDQYEDRFFALVRSAQD